MAYHQSGTQAENPFEDGTGGAQHGGQHDDQPPPDWLGDENAGAHHVPYQTEERETGHQADWLDENQHQQQQYHDTHADEPEDKPDWLADEEERKARENDPNYFNRDQPYQDVPYADSSNKKKKSAHAADAAAHEDDEYGEYDVEDDEDIEDDGAPRDYWGRKRKKCCDCLWNCCYECCMGFTRPPVCEYRKCWYVCL